MEKVKNYIAAVQKAINGLQNLVPPDHLKIDTFPNKLDPRIFHIQGMSGFKYRIFSNRLLSSDCFSSYLEIGCFMGSTAVSAMYKNADHIKKHWLIDNWSDFGGPRTQMINNWERFIPDTECNLIDCDCFSFDPATKQIENVDVYLYDGNHDEEAHYKSLSNYYNSFSDVFVLLVDDWFSCGNGGKPNRTCGENVRIGTINAIKDLNLKTHLKIETPGSGDMTGLGNPYEWWSGCGIFVLSK